MNEPAETRLGLRLDPLDVLFFRDGRPFGESTRAEGSLPVPQTLAGALRTALLARAGFDFAAFSQRRQADAGQPVVAALRHGQAPEWIIATQFRGPWLALTDGEIPEPLLPMPLNLACDGDVFSRADPLAAPLPGWDPPVPGLLPLWRRGHPDAKAASGFLTRAGVERFLAGDVPHAGEWRRADELYAFDHRTGIGVNPDTLTASDSLIYGVRFLALRHQVCLYLEVLLGPDAPDVRDWLTGPVLLGGEGRAVAVRTTAPVTWPALQGDNNRSVWLLTTPGLFRMESGWRPDRIPQSQMRAVAVGTALAVSGWDVARNGPKATRFAVPAGSVYFVEGEITPHGGSLCTDAEDIAQGWGCALQGVWNS